MPPKSQEAKKAEAKKPAKGKVLDETQHIVVFKSWREDDEWVEIDFKELTTVRAAAGMLDRSFNNLLNDSTSSSP